MMLISFKMMITILLDLFYTLLQKSKVSFELINFLFNFFDLHPNNPLRKLLIYVTTRLLKLFSFFLHTYFNSILRIKFFFFCKIANILRDSHTAKFRSTHRTEMCCF